MGSGEGGNIGRGVNREVIIRAEAKADLAEAYAWYEYRRTGLGADLVRAVDATIVEIQRRPASFRAVHKNIRRALTKRFPYGIFFVEEDDFISVIAIFHARRDPRIWQQRGEK